MLKISWSTKYFITGFMAPSNFIKNKKTKVKIKNIFHQNKILTNSVSSILLE